jgi:hypothetical protein
MDISDKAEVQDNKHFIVIIHIISGAGLSSTKEMKA